MDQLHTFFSHLYHFQDLIRWGGITVLTIIVFAETGLLVGFFLPGDSILVTAGLLCALDGVMNIWLLVFCLCLAAILGDTTGYWIGRKLGPRIFNKEDSLFFRKAHVEKTKLFFDKYGSKTIVIARFVPIVRTFAPTMAGVGEMNYKTFVTYNVLGGIGWVISMTLIGYFLGQIPGIEKKIHYIVLGIIFVSFLPIVKEWWQARNASAGNTPT